MQLNYKTYREQISRIRRKREEEDEPISKSPRADGDKE